MVEVQSFVMLLQTLYFQSNLNIFHGWKLVMFLSFFVTFASDRLCRNTEKENLRSRSRLMLCIAISRRDVYCAVSFRLVIFGFFVSHYFHLVASEHRNRSINIIRNTLNWLHFVLHFDAYAPLNTFAFTWCRQNYCEKNENRNERRARKHFSCPIWCFEISFLQLYSVCFCHFLFQRIVSKLRKEKRKKADKPKREKIIVSWRMNYYFCYADKIRKTTPKK